MSWCNDYSKGFLSFEINRNGFITKCKLFWTTARKDKVNMKTRYRGRSLLPARVTSQGIVAFRKEEEV